MEWRYIDDKPGDLEHVAEAFAALRLADILENGSLKHPVQPRYFIAKIAPVPLSELAGSRLTLGAVAPEQLFHAAIINVKRTTKTQFIQNDLELLQA